MQCINVRILAGACLLGLTLALSPAQDSRSEEDFDKELAELRDEYHRQLYRAKQPVLNKRIQKLRDWHARLSSKGHKDLAKRVKAELDRLESMQEKEAKAIEKLGPPKKPAKSSRKPKPKPPKPESTAIRLEFSKAKLEGGVRFDKKTKRLTGWASAQSRAEIPTRLTPGFYLVEIAYETTAKGRLRFEIGERKINHELTKTGKKTTQTDKIGRVTIKENVDRVIITMPIHRATPFAKLTQMHFVPLDSP